jgi:aryl-alcohol dehydrogenase-like predicted oxidoreductase
METRRLGTTDVELPILSYGASSLGQEFRQVDNFMDAIKCVPVALECGMNYIDTSPFYGRGMSEVMLGIALRGIPRDNYILSSKLGRYDLQHFDFSAKRVAESVDVSLHRLGVDYIDMMICHDIEFVDMQQIVDETIPALRKERDKGKIGYIGVSGYPMKMFKFILDNADVDFILSYNHYCLQNRRLATLLDQCEAQNVGVINAAPFAARLLTNAPLPAWHKASDVCKEACRKAAEFCTSEGVDIAQLAIQFSIANPRIASTMAGSANPNRVRQWAEWAAKPMDPSLLAAVETILAPAIDESHVEGLPENN